MGFLNPSEEIVISGATLLTSLVIPVQMKKNPDPSSNSKGQESGGFGEGLRSSDRVFPLRWDLQYSFHTSQQILHITTVWSPVVILQNKMFWDLSFIVLFEFSVIHSKSTQNQLLYFQFHSNVFPASPKNFRQVCFKRPEWCLAVLYSSQ